MTAEDIPGQSGLLGLLCSSVVVSKLQKVFWLIIPLQDESLAALMHRLTWAEASRVQGPPMARLSDSSQAALPLCPNAVI